jgi:hypothetical protein
MKETVCLDFDGVMNTYTKWAGEDELYQPREGLREFLEKLNENFKVVVHSTRAPEKIMAWLDQHGLLSLVSEVTAKKPPALCYVDDRAICFVGNFKMALCQIENFETYWE